MAGLEKDIQDDRNYKINLAHWEILEHSIRRKDVNNQCVMILFGGFITKEEYLDGADPISTKAFIVPLDEPSDGDEFTSLRAAVNVEANSVLSKSLKLAKKTQTFLNATEV